MNRKLLNTEEIRSRLTREGVGCALFYIEETNSTNEWAKKEAASGKLDDAVYLADYQTAGKGRQGRVWKTPPGLGISMSILLDPGEIPTDCISMLTLVMGLAAAQGMKQVTGLDVGIKWPNDVVCGGKKLCGILTETNSKAEYVVIGIGINCNMEEFPADIAATATSLRLETGQEVSREAIIAAIVQAFFRDYRAFLEHYDFSGKLKEEYEEILVNKDQRVRVLDPKGEYNGTAIGINQEGELLVQREDTGAVEQVYAGEVSVRGIYGYV